MILLPLALLWLLVSYLNLAWLQLSPSLELLLVVTPLLAALLLLWWRTPLLRLMLTVALLCLPAVWHSGNAIPRQAADSVALLNDHEVILQGVVLNEPELVRGKQRFQLRAEQLMSGSEPEPLSGAVLIYAERFPEFHYGERLQLEGKLSEPPVFEQFDYRAYLARQGVFSLASYPKLTRVAEAQADWRSPVLALRRALDAQLARSMPEPHAALSSALLLGMRTSLPEQLEEDFRLTGLSHVLAVSGWQVTLVVALATGIAGWIFRGRIWLVFVVSFVAVALYAILAGGSAAVVRAALMGIAALLGVALGRPRDGLNALGLACLAMALWSPIVLLDVGFQMSALATAGLILVAPLIRPPLAFLPGWIGEVVAMTLAAELMVLPVVVSSFGQLPLVAPLANLVVVPLVPGIMEWAAVGLLLGQVWEPLNQAAGAVATAYSWLTISLTSGLAALPFASLPTPRLSPLLAVIYYLLLFVLFYGRRNVTQTAVTPALVLGPLKWAAATAAATMLLLWLGLSHAPTDELRISFLDVGQGDATLIRTPSGHSLLVDGGPGVSSVAAGLAERLPRLQRHIDLLVLSHAHSDHLQGMIDVVERYRVGAVLQASAALGDSPLSARWRQLLVERSVPVVEAVRGQWIDLGAGAELELVYAAEAWSGDSRDVNDASLILLLRRGQWRALLPGDAGVAAQSWLLENVDLGQLSVIKVPHHGSGSSLSKEFVKRVAPRAAVISVGEGNRFSHPADSTLSLLADSDVLRTDEQGTIELTVDVDGAFRLSHRR